MGKIKKFIETNLFYIVISVVIFIFFVMGVFWIRKSTYSLNNENSINIVCPQNISKDIEDKTITCDISLSITGEKVLTVNANYDFGENVEYVSFQFTDICSSTECDEGFASTEDGFAFGSLNGYTSDTLIGNLSVKLPDNLVENTNYKIGLKNIELTYDADELPTAISDVFVNVTVIENTTLLDESLMVDEDNKIIKRILEGTKYSELKTKINDDASVVIKSNDDETMTDDSIIKTGDQITITLNQQSVTYTISVLGDLTGDGEIKINDVSKLYRYKKGRITITDKAILAAGDIVNDEELKINDISRLYRYKKGRITSLEVVNNE